MPTYISETPPDVSAGVSRAIKRLLNTKHLYQNVRITDEFKEDNQEVDIDIQFLLTSSDIVFSGSQALRAAGSSIYVSLTNIETFCTTCNERRPFASISATSFPYQGTKTEFGQLPPSCQTLHIGFCCQSCELEQVDFLISRKAEKLTISGRWPVENQPAPQYIPKAQQGFYSKAIITHNAGFTLAALLYLRVVIEQFWRSLELVDSKQRMTGDEFGSIYKSTLPDDFNNRFPSLTDIYDQLSGALHAANSDAALFDDSLMKLNRHFDGRRVYDL